MFYCLAPYGLNISFRSVKDLKEWHLSFADHPILFFHWKHLWFVCFSTSCTCSSFHRFTWFNHNLEWIDTHGVLAHLVTMICTSHLNVVQKAGWWGLLGRRPLLLWAVFLCSVEMAYWLSSAAHSPLLQWPTIVLLTILINLLNGLIVCVKYVGLMIDRAWISWMFSVILCLLKLLLFMSPTKTLLIVVILACLGLAALAFQLTKGVGDSEPSTELQEAMPALQ